MKSVLLVLCFLSVNLYAQDSEIASVQDTHTNPNLIEDGLYKALQNCKDENYYDTDNIKRVVWVNVEDNIINYVGESVSRSPQANLLSDEELIEVPMVEKDGDKFVAEYKFYSSPGIDLRRIYPMRNITCSIEITDSKLAK